MPQRHPLPKNTMFPNLRRNADGYVFLQKGSMILDWSSLRTRKPRSGDDCSRGGAEDVEEEFEENKDACSFSFFSPCGSASPREIFFITRRMRSLQISVIVLYPTLKASLSAAQDSVQTGQVNAG